MWTLRPKKNILISFRKFFKLILPKLTEVLICVYDYLIKEHGIHKMGFFFTKKN